MNNENLSNNTKDSNKRIEISDEGLELIEYINENSDARIFILTNGTLITDELIDKLYDHNICGVQISLDGYDSTSHDLVRGIGNFDKAIEAIKKLK